MCGIAGFVGNGSEQDLNRMIQAVLYRGPDDDGVLVRDGVGLAHARLAIIDVSPAGHQPMASGTGDTVIVFNGEIYNFGELKRLVPDYPFKSHSDTEVILALYERFGEDCFEKFDGMFALAIYDFKVKKLVLARDRMGKKPLYWSRVADTIFFGSELRALMTHPSFKKEINQSALRKYLFYEYVPTPHTIFKNVFKLEPASYLTFQNGQTDIKTFWKPDFSPTEDSFAQAGSQLDSALDRAVAKRLIADVPLGIFLSGGVDSSAITYYAKKHTKDVKTFSIGFERQSFDESSYARQVAQFLGTDHHEMILTAKDVLNVVPHLAEIIDEPLADPSLIPTYLLSQFTRSHVTVALGGDGGDELFAGYPMFQADYFAKIYEKIPRAIRKNIIEPLIRALPVGHDNLSLDFKLKRFMNGFDVPARYRHHTWLASFNPHEQELLLKEKGGGELLEDLDRYISESGTKNTDRQRDYLYLRTYLMDDILVKVDRASMHKALEVRAPLLDRDVVDLVDTFPTSFKQRGLTTKYILKKIMADKLPRHIVNRAKKGFGMPVAEWLCGELKPLCNELLARDKVMEAGLFHWDYIDRLKQAHFNKKANNYKQLWTLMVFQMWYQKWFL